MGAVIFDVDGTLVDSVDMHAKTWQDAFASRGYRIGYDDIRSQIGKGGDQLMPVFLTETQLQSDGEAIDARRNEILHAEFLPQISAFSGVRALLQRLRGDGATIALASSAKAEELQIYKKAARIEDLVDVETSSDDAEKSKPHPDIFTAALKRLGNPDTASVLVVGDTPYDAEAAGKAGLRMIGVLCGGFSEESLRRAGCIAVYEGPAGLLARYAETPLAAL